MVTTVVGLGFVGLTTALGFAEYGHKVYGLEADPKRLSTIQSGMVPFWEPELDKALTRHLSKNFIPTSNWKDAICGSEIIYYCVGTPYGPDGQADLTALYQAITETLDVLSDDKFRVLVIKSTVPPTTTQRQIAPFAASQGKNLAVANNPEFLREGRCWEDFIHADRIVLGVNDADAEALLRQLYKPSGIPVYSVSLNTGEYIKYLSNTVLACLISYANEMSLAANAMGGIDVAAAFRILHMDHRWQNGTIRNYFYPGCGYGGYCLPKDTNAFYAAAKHAGFEGNILREVIRTNGSMPEMTAKRIIRAAKEDPDTCIGILGLSFNPGSNDVRDTPSAKIIQALNQAGYRNILAYDPIAMKEFQAQYGDLTYCCATSQDQVLESADIVAVITAWREFFDIKKRTEKPIVDCRYVL